MTGTASEFLTWFSSWGNVIFVAAQMLFWAAVGFAAVYGALSYKRFVDHKIGSTVREKVAAPAAINIDEFVE